jgi:hypothetical protein
VGGGGMDKGAGLRQELGSVDFLENSVLGNHG